MTNREKFIYEVEELLKEEPDFFSEGAASYFEELKNDKVSAGEMTENGRNVLSFMIENEKTFNNIFNAKNIGEGLFVSSRVVSGAMRKLVKDGYVEKMGQNPVSYSLTEAARSWQA